MLREPRARAILCVVALACVWPHNLQYVFNAPLVSGTSVWSHVLVVGRNAYRLCVTLREPRVHVRGRACLCVAENFGPANHLGSPLISVSDSAKTGNMLQGLLITWK